MSWLHLVLLLLAACSEPRFLARYAQTAPICGWEPALPTRAALGPGPLPDAACVEAVLADLSVDVDAFVAADHLEDACSVLRGDERSRLALLLGAVAALGALELGELSDAPPILADALAPVAAVTGEVAIVPLLYDYVAGHVAEVRTSDARDVWATFDPSSRVLAIADLPRGVDGAAILAHEARHGDGVVHVACRGSDARGDESCDDAPDGAWGFQRALHRHVLDATDDPELAADQRAWVRSTGSFIEVGP